MGVNHRKHSPISRMKRPYGGFLKWGYPNSWLVYRGKSHLKMDDLGNVNGYVKGHRGVLGHWDHLLR